MWSGSAIQNMQSDWLRPVLHRLAEMLFDWCLEKRVLQETYRGIYTETPDAAWNVDRCYCRSLGSWEDWLLVRDNCIIEIQNREPLTAEQKKIILQQLGL